MPSGNPGVPRPSTRTYVLRTLADYPTPTPQPTPCRLWQGALDGGYGVRPIHGMRNRKQRIHVWVWEQINGPVPEGMVVRHLCDQPLCYRYDHLVLGTQADNIQDMHDRGRYNAYSGGLTDDQVLTIRRRLAAGEQGRALAVEYGVSEATISEIKNRRHWRHLPEGNNQ